MKIAIIGTFILDKIHTFDGKIVESLGGISYTIAALANLLSETDEIYPVANVGIDVYDTIIQYLSEYKNVRLNYINRENKNNTRVTLKYYNKESRDEYLVNRLSPIQSEQINRLNKFDIILINFITGFELSLETCNKICQQSNSLIYMDYHSLCLGIDNEGKRFLRKPLDWKHWLTGIDILQLNEDEATILSDGKDKTILGFELLNSGINIVHITLGSNGSLLFYRNNNKSQLEKIAPYHVDTVHDVTGCGDAFAGGFLVSYWHISNALIAAQNANRVAGFNCTLTGLHEIHKLSKLKNLI